MTKSEILEGNKLIAQFMGMKRGWWISQQKPLTEYKKQWCDIDGKTFLEAKVYYDKDLLFNSSWDWLMLAIDKIEGLGFKMFSGTSDILSDKYYINIVSGVGILESTLKNPSKFMGTSNSKIEAWLKAVIDFIKWYNENKSK